MPPPSAHPWDQPGSKNSLPSSERASGSTDDSKVGDIDLGFDAGILPWARQNKQIGMEACGTVDLGVLVGTQLAHEPHFTVRLYQAGREWQVYRAPPPPTHTPRSWFWHKAAKWVMRLQKWKWEPMPAITRDFRRTFAVTVGSS